MDDVNETSIMEPERLWAFREFNDSFILDNGVTPRAVETLSSKRLNKESHPCAAPSPSVNSVIGGVVRGGEGVE